MKYKIFWILILAMCGCGLGGSNSNGGSSSNPSPDPTIKEPDPVSQNPTTPPQSGAIVTNSIIKDGSGNTIGSFIGWSSFAGNQNDWAFVMLSGGPIVLVDMMRGVLHQEKAYFETLDCSGSAAYFKTVDSTQPLMIMNRVIAPGDGTYYKVNGFLKTSTTAHSIQNGASGGGCTSTSTALSANFAVTLEKIDSVFDLTTIAPITIQ